MLTLGIETSCDETAVSVVREGKVLSNIVSSSVHLYKKYGGVVPEIASRYHVEYIIEVLSKALKGSGKSLKVIDLIAVTSGPGLVGSLLAGISLAKAISYSLRLPLIGVSHILAHLYSAFLSEKGNGLRFPFIGMVVSGGHTVLYYCEDIDSQTMLGQTQDDAVGEAYDKVAKILKLGYPGGGPIEKMALLSKRKDGRIFPRTYLSSSSLDFSFSGIKTAVLYYAKDMQGRGKGIGESGKLSTDLISDICYAFQEAVLDVLVDKAILATKMKRVGSIVVGGGVAVNSRLREKFFDASGLAGIKVWFPKRQYCMDNAAMVAALGERLYKKGHRSDLYLSAEPNLEVS